MVPVESLRVWRRSIFISKFYWTKSFEVFFNNNLNIVTSLGNEVWKTQPPKIAGKLLEHTNGED